VLVRGSLVTLISPNKTKAKNFTLTVEQKEGKQSIEKCEGASKDLLESSLDGGVTFLESGEEAKEGTVEFETVEQEAMA
jgi:hypothetical protein